MNRLLFIILALFLTSWSLNAQTKAESRLYQKTIAKPSAAAYEKFLKKYPASVYAEDILARKDTLFNITPYTEEQAVQILKGFLPEDALVKAFPHRINAVDYIQGICISASGLAKDNVILLSLIYKDGIWNLQSKYDSFAIEVPEHCGTPYFVDSTKVFKIRDNYFYQANYLYNEAQNRIYVSALYSPSQEQFSCLAFSGKDISKDGEAYKIEGRSNENMTFGMEKPEMKYLLNSFKSNASLVYIPDNIYESDMAIKWWLEQNPNALTDARKLTISILPEICSLVEDFPKSKLKAQSSRYTAVIMDVRDFTVIVAYDKNTKQYYLAWVEAKCKDKYKDRLLNSISFKDNNNLSLNYYHGRRTYKYSLNLTSKTIVR